MMAFLLLSLDGLMGPVEASGYSNIVASSPSLPPPLDFGLAEPVTNNHTHATPDRAQPERDGHECSEIHVSSPRDGVELRVPVALTVTDELGSEPVPTVTTEPQMQ
jgi:hypothetical protein